MGRRADAAVTESPLRAADFVPLATRTDPGGTKPSLHDAFVPLGALSSPRGTLFPARTRGLRPARPARPAPPGRQ
jgi:hypothetical protein